ncbi:AbiH family protein [Exiguobacterium sp. s191]|uniref:AbiH family protein n=1 Tax=Exiguobacterium sp. s191 TaxID=2751196 RepID=UPI001BEBC01D|nr:AbiH family protein [Exiguobacterium sp. s191]
MNITFLIGNGFDINIGLNTSYSSFYEHLKNRNHENQKNKLIENILNDYFNKEILKDSSKDKKDSIEQIDWSDFEIAVGSYTKKIETKKEIEEFIKDYEEFIDYFTSYIEEGIDNNLLEFWMEENLNSFENSIKNPINTYERDQHELTVRYSNYRNITKNFNYVIFNYTEIFDLLHQNWKKHYSQTGITSNSPIHIHGYCQEQILLGVNDESQIHSKLSSNESLQMMMIKTISNQYALSTRLERTISVIKNSELIIIYGMSLGESDKFWWELIIERLKKDSKKSVLIYAYESDQKGLIKHHRRMMNKQKEWKEKLLKYASEEEKEILSKQIFIQFDTLKIFNFIKLSSEVFSKQTQ